jgi:hypothetical protein
MSTSSAERNPVEELAEEFPAQRPQGEKPAATHHGVGEANARFMIKPTSEPMLAPRQPQ